MRFALSFALLTAGLLALAGEASAQQCGDGACAPVVEGCWSCPEDCPCPSGTSCVAVPNGHSCEQVVTCGDGTCTPYEEGCWDCPQDCPCPSGTSCVAVPNGHSCEQVVTCGDGTCTPYKEGCWDCPQDCPCPSGTSCVSVPNGHACQQVVACGDGTCTPYEEGCWDCPQDCPCPSGTSCVSVPNGHACQQVVACGDGTCTPYEEGCWDCPQDCPCPQGKTCVAVPNGHACQRVASCGDGTCTPYEEGCWDCPQDCPCPSGTSCAAVSNGHECVQAVACGDGTCTPYEEGCWDCPEDCPCPAGTSCAAVPNGHSCTSIETCGDDVCQPVLEGCGNCPGDCPCPAGSICTSGVCAPAAGCGDGRCSLGENCPADCSGGFSVQIDGPFRGAPGRAIGLSASVSMLAGDPVSSYQWDFGDGGVATTPQPKHTYVSIGVYLLRLTVTTASGLSLSATSTVTVAPDVVALGRCRAGDCTTSLDFAYLPATDELVGAGRISIPLSSPDATGYAPYVDLYIWNPSGQLVFNSGRRLSAAEVTSFVVPELLHPDPGVWHLTAVFSYIGLFYPEFFPVDILARSAFVPTPSPIDVQPAARTIEDGEPPVALTATLPPGASGLQWTFERPLGSEPGIAPTLTAEGSGVQVKASWFANPVQACASSPSVLVDQAFSGAAYTILAVANLPGGGIGRGQARITVQMPWIDLSLGGKGDAGRVESPSIKGRRFERVVPLPGGGTACHYLRDTYVRGDPAKFNNLKPDSRFFQKVEVHENVHVDQFVQPDRVWSDINTVAGLRAFSHPVTGVPLVDLSAPTCQQLFRLWSETEEAYRMQGLRTLADPVKKDQAECEAWKESDKVDPHFILERCNTIYRSCP